ncbi:hypothetical protein N1F78_12535 [Seonamhaeicola sp. MEBiC1930]|uniref:hypothetical protein n=1 Tax=Seonamhaeicola sp. MEBiC01930 TaxID=2976768 RepID=UPI003243DAA1
MRKQYLLITILALVAQFAQAQFTLEGEFRPRTELFGSGQSSTAADGSDAWLQTSVRAALMATYKAENYTYYMSFQEVFLHGDRQQIAASGNGNFRVQEAWVDFKLDDKWSFKLGRQPLSYDDQRILGGLGWAQQARTHDVGIIKHKSGSFSLDAGYAVNTIGGAVYNNATLFTYRNLGFVHAHTGSEKFNVSALLLNTTYQNGGDKSNLFTGGLHAKAKLGSLGLASNFYLQSGNRVGEVEVKGALLYSLDATYKVSDKVTILAGFESIGGKTDDSAAFFPLYGTNHKFNGLMDRFYVGNHGNAGGLVDINFGAKFGLGKGWGLTAKFHTFSEESPNVSTSTENLGSEIDLVIAKGFKGFKLVSGYSQFFEPDFVTGAKGTQNWAWAMIIVKPKFLNTAK